MEVIETSLIAPTQFDSKSKYFDPKSTQENPRWDCVQVRYLGIFNQPISLEELRNINSTEILLY